MLRAQALHADARIRMWRCFPTGCLSQLAHHLSAAQRFELCVHRHFMLTPTDEEVEVLVDAFNGGEVCFLEDAADKLATIHGIQVLD